VETFHAHGQTPNIQFAIVPVNFSGVHFFMGRVSTMSALRDETPQYLDYLTESEREGYSQLRGFFDGFFTRLPGFSKVSDHFQEAVDRINTFVVSEDSVATQRRSLVCGIIWCGDCIAINTRQLCLLLRKCKSSVNNGFQAIGYHRVTEDTEIAMALARAFPFMKSDLSQARQWTFRSIPDQKRGISCLARTWSSQFDPEPFARAVREEFDELSLEIPSRQFGLTDSLCDFYPEKLFIQESDW
jgi:hypothetical protein